MHASAVRSFHGFVKSVCNCSAIPIKSSLEAYVVEFDVPLGLFIPSLRVGHTEIFRFVTIVIKLGLFSKVN